MCRFTSYYSSLLTPYSLLACPLQFVPRSRPESFFPAWNSERIDYRVGNFAVKDRENALRRHSLPGVLRPRIGADDMRRHNELGWIDRAQRVVERRRFFVKHVQCRPGDDFLVQRLDQIGFFDRRAARVLMMNA